MKNLVEERKYERLRKLAQELHVPIPEHFITLEVFDKDGKLIQKHHQRSHSWTRNAYNIMFCQLAAKDGDDATFGAGKLSNKNMTGAIVTGDRPLGLDYDSKTADSTLTGYRAVAADDALGILVGSGTDAESFEDYQLQTQVEEGTGPNQLSHVASEAHAITYTDTTLTNTLVRYFNNNTVGVTSVDINEVVLHMHSYRGGAAMLGIVSRDKLASTVTVPSTGQLKVTYTISLTYPA